MGLMNSLTTLMNCLPNGSMATPVSGEKCPSIAPAKMAVSTQKVSVPMIFFKRFFNVSTQIHFEQCPDRFGRGRIGMRNARQRNQFPPKRGSQGGSQFLG